MGISEATSPEDMVIARTLFREYAESIGIDLSFQGFQAELDGLPGKYAPPRGALFIASEDSLPLGCVAIRPLDAVGVAELKRLYVRPAGRGKGVGKALTRHAIDRARAIGYRAIRLDTLATMKDAQTLYRKLGFREIPAYTFNPLPGVTFMELELVDRDQGAQTAG
jgi:ribosomal protein S18 acetylase RimI-like enzyme